MGDRPTSKDLHVAVVTPWETRGGIADYSERFVDALRAEGPTVTPVPIEFEQAANPFRFTDVLDAVPPDADVLHTQFEAGVFGRFLVSGTAAPSYFRAVGRLEPPHVTTLHEVHREHPHLSAPGGSLLRLRDRLIERTALASSSAVVVHTRHAERILRDRHGDRGRVERLLHPVETAAAQVDPDDAKRSFGLEPDDAVVATFGWVEPKKRYEDVFEALAELPEVTYLVAGEPRTSSDEDYLADVRSAAERRGVGDRVRHLGYVPDEQVPALFSAADVVVLPYDRVAQSGAVNLALGYARPVVTSSLPAFEELHDEFGCLRTYGDTADLTAELETLLSDAEARAELTAAANRYRSTVTWDRFARETVELYESIRR